MAGYIVTPQEKLKVNNEPKSKQQVSQQNTLNSWMQFWSMIQDTFKDKKGNWKNPFDTVKDLGTAYAGKERLKKYNEILGK